MSNIGRKLSKFKKLVNNSLVDDFDIYMVVGEGYNWITILNINQDYPDLIRFGDEEEKREYLAKHGRWDQ